MRAFFEFSVVTAHLDGKAARAYPPPLLIVHFIQHFFFTSFSSASLRRRSRAAQDHSTGCISAQTISSAATHSLG